ncbi:Arc family DNA-binding protein [Burkholderia gladioli]|uniref:Arc family DNA-binding protein n=1 Tax=Burkholderia gladioli TaxID=28095 RepID=UPI0023647A15|nr:Arc family DNA-binding protein [Burkholderia gladioli]MDD1789106.1 Arc family DNA-binding protein [Burkholderia gladioli]
MAKQDDYTKTALRLPRDLHQKLMESASANGHSLNTEMIHRLARSFEEPIYGGEGAPMRTFEDVERRLQNLARQMDLKLRLVKAPARAKPGPLTGPQDVPPGTTKRTIPKK